MIFLSDRPDQHMLLSLPHIAVWGLRAYAVFQGSKIIVVIFGSLELVVISLSVVRVIPLSPYARTVYCHFFHTHQLHVPYVSCTSTSRKEPLVPLAHLPAAS